MTATVSTALRDRIADLVRESGESQKDLSRRAGVSQQTLSAILTGVRTDLRAEVVARLLRALGQSPTAAGRLLYDSFPAADYSVQTN